MATNAATLAKTGKFGDLRRRLVFLLLALVVYRIGAHIPVPGINPDQLAKVVKTGELSAKVALKGIGATAGAKAAIEAAGGSVGE